jgi:hypothetical protein
MGTYLANNSARATRRSQMEAAERNMVRRLPVESCTLYSPG